MRAKIFQCQWERRLGGSRGCMMSAFFKCVTDYKLVIFSFSLRACIWCVCVFFIHLILANPGFLTISCSRLKSVLLYLCLSVKHFPFWNCTNLTLFPPCLICFLLFTHQIKKKNQQQSCQGCCKSASCISLILSPYLFLKHLFVTMRLPSSLLPCETCWDGSESESGGGCTSSSSLETDWLIITAQKQSPWQPNFTLTQRTHPCQWEKQEVVHEMCASERQMNLKASFLISCVPHVCRLGVRRHLYDAFCPAVEPIWANDLQLKPLL